MIARTYNWDVKRRREMKGTGKGPSVEDGSDEET
jgi:hypothetical protein